MPFTAAVYGASGACGASIVAALCASPDWDRVLAVGRTPPPPPPSGADTLTPVPADLAALASPAPLAGVDAVFCALGTTRATAATATPSSSRLTRPSRARTARTGPCSSASTRRRRRRSEKVVEKG